MIDLLDAAARLASAGLLSGLIGFEREYQRKPAGLRTHMLVGLGSALFGIVSLVAFGAEDTSRIAAGVVTGVGFLGAGAIFREGQFVRGLTTAAGMWVVAGIGLAAGAGNIGLAAVATGVALAVLLVLGAVENYLNQRSRGARVRGGHRRGRFRAGGGDPPRPDDRSPLLRSRFGRSTGLPELACRPQAP